MELSGGQRYVAETHHQTQTTAWLGGTLVFSVRIREDLVEELGALSSRTGCSRNELIHLFLQYALQNYIIEWCPAGNHPCQPGLCSFTFHFWRSCPLFHIRFCFYSSFSRISRLRQNKKPAQRAFLLLCRLHSVCAHKKRAGSGSFFRHNNTPWKAEERL